MELMVLDGNSIVNRAFYGVRPLNAPDGTPTNAVYGFLSILQKLLSDHKPQALCVAFDLPGPTFRKEKFEAYKAHRKPMPEDLAVQLPLLREVLGAMGILMLSKEGMEADDVIGTVGRLCADRGTDCLIVTGDKDSFQLIEESVKVLHIKSRMGKTESILYDEKRFEEEYGFAPKLIIDLKALMGDSSDNIPGVAGVGEKTAMSLVGTYGGIDEIYAKIDELDVKEGVRTKLRTGEADARLSYELATIVKDVHIEFAPDMATWQLSPTAELYEVMERLGFNRFIDMWGLKAGGAVAEIKEKSALPRVKLSDFTLESVPFSTSDALALHCNTDFTQLEICDGLSVYTAERMDMGGGFDTLFDFLFSDNVEKTGHNIKDIMTALLTEGAEPRAWAFDTALAAYVIDPTEADYDLKKLSIRYLGYECEGAEAVYLLREPLHDTLCKMGADKLYYETELPLCEVLSDMEHRGFAVDKKALFDFGESLNEDIKRLQNSIYSLAGEDFNINSPKQLGEILFGKLGLPSGKKTKTGYSTNVDVLEKLKADYPIVQAVLDYRSLAKLKSTYAEGLLKVTGADGRIHTNFKMTVTATGRLSSTEPNLQNIPVRTERGAELRKMFTVSEGYKLVDADYSQIELRLLAHISGDETMLRAFAEGEDIHTVTASQVFGVALDEVTSLQRSRAKAVNFGIVYGISAFSLAQDIGVWQSEAKAYIEAYLEKYSGVAEYMKRVIEQAKEDGYVETLFGRRRALPEIKSKNHNMRSFGERVALNMPIQGTAADIIKMAMVAVYRRLRAENLKSQLILQVHDELIAECPEAEVEAVQRILTEEMEGAVRLKVSMKAEAKVGKTWAEAH